MARLASLLQGRGFTVPLSHLTAQEKKNACVHANARSGIYSSKFSFDKYTKKKIHVCVYAYACQDRCSPHLGLLIRLFSQLRIE